MQNDEPCGAEKRLRRVFPLHRTLKKPMQSAQKRKSEIDFEEEKHRSGRKLTFLFIFELVLDCNREKC